MGCMWTGRGGDRQSEAAKGAQGENNHNEKTRLREGAWAWAWAVNKALDTATPARRDP